MENLFRKVSVPMFHKTSELRPNDPAGKECREDDLKRKKMTSASTTLAISSFRKKLRIVGRVRGEVWEVAGEKRTAVLSRRFRKDAFLVEIGNAFLVLAPADSLNGSFYAAVIDGRSRFHLALCEKCRKTDRWSFRSAESGKILKISNVLILGEVLAFEETQTSVESCSADNGTGCLCEFSADILKPQA